MESVDKNRPIPHTSFDFDWKRNQKVIARVSNGMDRPPGSLKLALYSGFSFNLNFITARDVPTNNNSIEMVARTSSCLNPPEMASKKEMMEKVMIDRWGVA